jgi:metal-dependent amidase/aminoacylase/carboxypeptidase family protein
VIADEVALTGTIRYMDSGVRDKLHIGLDEALSISHSMGCDYRLEMNPGSGPIVNHEMVVEAVRSAASAMLGDESILPRDEGMGAEDFAAYAAMVPAAMFRLGCRLPGEERKAHNPNFDIDEACLPIGAALLADTSLRLLAELA